MGRAHVLITGGASGLGLGCATHFRRLGYDLTLADVDAAASERALLMLAALPGPGSLRVQAVDLSDPASIATAAESLKARAQPIDVLVNNAGIYPPALRRGNAEGHELSFAIAHLGHFRLTHALWPLLESAAAARVISISSLVQRQAHIQLDDLDWRHRYVPILAYRQTKLACLLFALELHRRLQAAGHRISSYAAHPGVCRTQIGRNRPRSAQDNAWQRLATAALATGLSHMGQSPEAGARPVIAVATTNEFPAGSLVGPRWLNESFGRPVRIALGRAARDPTSAAALWTRTEELTGLRWPL
ncbi:SDR family NAD(P)-dependent oxidoreductase [Hydrocarboniphaga effusa]|uniref:SDR family NAD(P)-dependent oxidoreductase n=1 Tax=Hydrocarboniphaga effusa TaxID=243629 RepID=UPI000590BBBB